MSEADSIWRVLPNKFRQVQQLARQTFGFDIKAGKEALVSARLNRRMRAVGVKEVRHYLNYVQGDATEQELLHLVDALTTNFTSFRREAAHFELLKTKILNELPGTSEIRIWSAGCSSGEEPYSILFELVERLGAGSTSRVKILASDISGRALEQARRAIYPLEKLKEMPAAWQLYLEKGAGEWTGHFRIARPWRSPIDFRRINLMDSFEHVAQFHVIFCRNMMIYFDRSTQKDLVRRFTGCLKPGGWFLIGHSESHSGLHSALKYIQPATYRGPGTSVGQ